MKLPVFILAIFALGCTETVEVEKIVRDTVEVPVQVFIDRVRIDSVAYPVFVTDTLIVQKILTTIQYDTIIDVDTVFIEKIVETIVYDTVINTVYVYDTLVIREHIYHDTLYIFPGRGTYNVGIYQNIVSQFYLDAAAYGRNPSGGNLVISPWEQSEAPPDNRSSFIYYHWDQWIIKLRDDITSDEAYTPLYRELARIHLDKPYTKDPDDFMNPSFDWRRVGFSSTDAEKLPFLNKLFAQ